MEHGGFHGYQRLVNSSSGTIKLEINHSLNHHAPTNNTSEQDPNAREQDRYMPIANVIKIMPKVLPTHAKIYDDAKEMIQECVSEYVSFITGEANEQCQREQRKTITANDVLYAMRKLGFDDYVKPLSLYIQRYRELDSERGSTRSERVMKRSAEMSSMGVVAFEPDFHIGPHQGLFGAPMRGYLRDGSGASSSQAELPGFNPYVSYK